MAPEKKVVDASVIVKWFVDEPDSKQAGEIRNAHITGDIRIIVPELTIIEVMNALRYKKINDEQLQEAHRTLWDVQLHIEKTTFFLLEKALVAARKHNLSVYDALYAALAQIYGTVLITTDEALAKLPNAQKLA